MLQHPRLYRRLVPLWRFLLNNPAIKNLTTRWLGENRFLPPPAPRSFFESLPP